MSSRVGGPVIIVDAVMGQGLGCGDVGDSQDIRSRHRCVIVFGSSCKHGPSLYLIITTCRVFRHLWTLEITDDPSTQLAVADFE